MKELREACRKYTLKVSGNKDVLVVRLAAFLVTMTKAQREETKGGSVGNEDEEGGRKES